MFGECELGSVEAEAEIGVVLQEGVLLCQPFCLFSLCKPLLTGQTYGLLNSLVTFLPFATQVRETPRFVCDLDGGILPGAKFRYPTHISSRLSVRCTGVYPIV